MNIIKYDPLRELRSLQDEMTRLFGGVAPSNREGDEAGQPSAIEAESKKAAG